MNQHLVTLIAKVLYDKHYENEETLAWFIVEALRNEPLLDRLHDQAGTLRH